MTGSLQTISTHPLKNSSKSPRFLFFLYYFPPDHGTAPRRNHQIASELAQYAEFARAFTSAKEKAEPQATEGIEVVPIQAFDYRAFLRKRTDDGALPEEKKQGGIAQFIIKLINTFPVSIMLGEGGMFYFFSLIRKGHRTIKE